MRYFKQIDELSILSISVFIGFIMYSWMYFLIQGSFYRFVFRFFITMYSLFYIENNLDLFDILKKKWFIIKVALIFTSYTMFFFYISYYFGRNKTFRTRVYPDIGLHESIVMSFAVGCNSNRKKFFDVYSTLKSGEKLLYPFIPDYHASILVKDFNFSLKNSFLLPSFFLVFSFYIGIYNLSYIIVKDSIICVLSLFLFVNLGGIGFLFLKYNEFFENDSDFIHRINGFEYFWHHSILHMIIPQRSSVYSFPGSVWIIYLVNEGFLKKNRLIALAGILTCLLPFVQVHSYIGVGIYVFFFYLIRFRAAGSFIYQALVYGSISILLAIPQLLFLTMHYVDNQTLRIAHIPNVLKFNSYLSLWIYSLGLFFINSILVFWFFVEKTEMFIYIPSLFVFLISNIIIFQQWTHDNIKILYSGWIPVACPIVAKITYILFQKRKYVLFVIAILIMSLSSLICHIWCFSYYYKVIKAPLSLSSMWIQENTPLLSISVSQASQYNPLLLSGRISFLQNPSTALSHNLISIGIIDINDALCDFWDDYRQYELYNISYVLSCDDLPYFHPTDECHRWELIYNFLGYKIWKFTE